MTSVDVKLPRSTFMIGELTVVPDSQLDTMAQLNPAACLNYANVLIQELEEAMSEVSLNDPTVTLPRVFEQIHRLKNFVSQTGCQSLLRACSTLQTNATMSTGREELQNSFNEIAKAAQLLIVTYRNGLPGSNATQGPPR